MKYVSTICLSVLVLMAMIASGCQNTESVNSNTAPDPHAGHGNMDHTTAPAANNDKADMKHDMSNMAPMASAPGAADQPYDLQFIDSMISHHQGAVVMSAATLKTTERNELGLFLQKVIDDQEKEIAQMKEWREKWYAGKPSALNMELPGMTMSYHEMQGTISDVHYVDMMIPHHEGAVLMAKDALQKAEHPEIKKLANEIIRSQEAEIKRMREWKTQWSK
jgi:uncharacterized protein (DUF305 family)